MSKYAFTTVVATAEDRAMFTKLRESLNSSDKELFQAIFEIANENMEYLVKKVEEKQATRVAIKAAAKAAKAGSKKDPEKKVKRVKKQKAPVVVEHIVSSDDDDFECVVVDGTR